MIGNLPFDVAIWCTKPVSSKMIVGYQKFGIESGRTQRRYLCLSMELPAIKSLERTRGFTFTLRRRLGTSGRDSIVSKSCIGEDMPAGRFYGFTFKCDNVTTYEDEINF